MNISYDTVIGAFLSKITEYNFSQMNIDARDEAVLGYLNRSVSAFNYVCVYDLSKRDKENKAFSDDFKEEDVDEIVDILSEGMLIQWMKPFVYTQDLLENRLNTNDFSAYSPSELLMRVGNAYKQVREDYTQMVREYSYNHGDLTGLHL